MTDTAAKAPTHNLADVIYQRLKQDIFSFQLKPGQRFTESDIAEQYQISRTPIRQALYRLEQERFVDVHFRSGWQVKTLDFNLYRDLFDLRMLLETEAVKRLCQKDLSASTEIQNLRQIWLAHDREQDQARLTVLSEDFHCALVRALDNQEMTRIHQDLSEKLRIIMHLGMQKPLNIRHTYDEHAAILEAILAKDMQQALHLVQHHVQDTLEHIQRITLQQAEQLLADADLSKAKNQSLA